MDFAANVQGIRQLEKMFNQLPKTLARKAYMKSLRKGGALVKRQAENNLRSVADSGYSTGQGEKNIRVYNLRKFKGSYRVGVQIKRGAVNNLKIIKGQPVRMGLYLSVLEYGKENQPPRPWLRKALDQMERESIRVIAEEMNKNMSAAIEEARK